MKAKFLLLTATLFAAAAAQGAERIDVANLPDPVRRTLLTDGVSAPVKEVKARKIAGKTVYEIELERNNATNVRLFIAEDGTILSDSRREPADSLDAAASAYTEFVAPVFLSKLRLADLPIKVQDTIRKKSDGRKIAVINTGTLDGQIAYRAEFRERGRNSRIYIAEDGSLLRPEEKPPVLPTGTKFTDTPAAVQETIRREAGQGEIINIRRKGLVAEPSNYTVEIRDRQNRFELGIAEDGTITRDSRINANPLDGR